MSDLYKRISRTDFILGIISCAAVLFASTSLCTDCGNKYLMIFAIVINSVCGTINFQQSIRYKKQAKEEAEKCYWCILGFHCLKGNNTGLCIDREQCSDYMPKKIKEKVKEDAEHNC